MLLSVDRVVLGSSGRLVLLGSWNAIFDSKLDWVWRSGSKSAGFESSLIDFMAKIDLHRFLLGHPRREMWSGQLIRLSSEVNPTWIECLLDELIQTFYLARRSLGYRSLTINW